jgi:lysozyme
MKINAEGLKLIKKWEGFKDHPYLDGGGVATIGYGNTFYENGMRVKLQDVPITEVRATELLLNTVRVFESGVDSITRDDITSNQFSALVVFCYNIGINALRKSTLIKLVNQNPKNPLIKNEFQKWCYDNGKMINGLKNRRLAEANLYFKA